MHSNATGSVFYEAKWEPAYYMIRHGKILHIIEERFGKWEAEVVTSLLELGCARVKELAVVLNIAGYGEKEKEGDEPVVNGDTQNGEVNGDAVHEVENKRTMDDLQSVLRKLAEQGFIHKLCEAHLRPYADNLVEAQRWVVENKPFPDLRGQKLAAAQADAAHQRVEELMDGTIASEQTANGVMNGRKRGLEDSGGHLANKRAKLSNGNAAARPSAVTPIDVR